MTDPCEKEVHLIVTNVLVYFKLYDLYLQILYSLHKRSQVYIKITFMTHINNVKIISNYNF